MKTLFIIFILVALVAIVASLQLKAAKKTGRAGTYRRRKLMTDNELEFFGRLVAALPDHLIFPQVAMSGLIEAASSDKKMAHSDRLKIAQQRVDYVVCTTTCEVIAVIELDDKTHSSAKDALRDSRLEQTGIRTVRFQSRNKPTPDAIRAMIVGAAPVVPEQEAPSVRSRGPAVSSS